MRAKRLIVPSIFALVGFAILAGLGIWQLERKAWKEGLIAQIEDRAKAAPISLAAAVAAHKSAADLDMTRVATRGHFLEGREFPVLTPLREGAGWSIIAPFETPEGVILVDRGTVPDALKDPARRPQSRISGDIEIVGRVRGSERVGLFTPDNEPARNLWYSRNLDGMRAALPSDIGLRTLPFFLELEALPAAGSLPKPKDPTIDLPNDHLQYAITWFLLAAGLAGVFFFFVRGELKGGRDGRPET